MSNEEAVGKIPGIILSGGESRRMGSPKALLKYGKSTFAETIVSKFTAAGVGDISMVLGGGAENLRSKLKIKDLKIIVNPDWSGGQITSLRAALRETDEDAAAVIVSLIDNPGVEVTTIRLLLKEFLMGDYDIIIPEYKGRGGHPVVFGRRTFKSILYTEVKNGARDIIRSGKFRVKRLSLDDPGIRQDIDTPADYEKLVNKV
ncbi:MAG: nucleotidyltransferase family protein [Elusimicrobia bacterium]|nr:nucleotidyltransferase family protein [Elusimicrobiota bacterium]